MMVHLLTFGVMFLFGLVPWIIFLVAAWRGMIAAESIAESLRKMANKQDLSGGPQ
jgi:hypothetical protein